MKTRVLSAIAIAITLQSCAWAQRQRLILANEQGRIAVNDPTTTPPSSLPYALQPPTIRSAELPVVEMSLDEAIRVAVQNADAIRVLSGVGAASSGQTIYSPGIANTTIDQARAAFDPTVSIQNNFLRNESPSAQFDPLDPNRALIRGTRSDAYDFNLDISKRNLNGSTMALRAGTNRSRFQPGVLPLNPQSTSNVDLSLSQPLLRGRGADANAVPIVLAFLDTQQSYFRLKNSVQGLVQGVIQGYWDLVQARTDLWVLRQQLLQAEFANYIAETQLEVGRFNTGQVVQTRSSLANFRANIVATESALLDRVASLRGILGLPPGSDYTIVPTTRPIQDRIEFDWEALVQLAGQRRPDLVELKLILDADYQRLLRARNQAQPQLDATAVYRWNGLEGEMPIGDRIEADPGQHTDWALAVNFSVPLTLRAERATLRQVQLLIASDRTNLRQRELEISHSLAASLRDIAQLYAQHEAFTLAREASKENLDLQLAEFKEGRVNFLDVLLAINNWGSSVSSQARAVTQLNATFAALENSTGTILETHGVRLFEERYCSLGPLGKFGKGRDYPMAMRPSQNTPRYLTGEGPAEQAFDLRSPIEDSELNLDANDQFRSRPQRLPAVPDDN